MLYMHTNHIACSRLTSEVKVDIITIELSVVRFFDSTGIEFDQLIPSKLVTDLLTKFPVEKCHFLFDQFCHTRTSTEQITQDEGLLNSGRQRLACFPYYTIPIKVRITYMYTAHTSVNKQVLKSAGP